jgi:hypothetical protein
MREHDRDHQIEQVGEGLRSMMPWLQRGRNGDAAGGRRTTDGAAQHADGGGPRA